MKKPMNNKKGITLAELIITAAIMVILLGALSSTMLIGTRYYQQGKDISDATSDATTAMLLLENSLRYCTKNGITPVTETTQISNSTQRAYYFSDGTFYISYQDGDNPITMAFYDIAGITLSFQDHPSDFCSVQYVITAKNGTSISGSSVMNNISSSQSQLRSYDDIELTDSVNQGFVISSEQ